MKSGSVNKQKKERTLEYLFRLKEMGYLFHGTSKQIMGELRPQYTLDENCEENTGTAVFATDNIAWAIIFGLYGGYKGWSTRISGGMVTAKIPSKHKKLVENTTGRVFVLPPDGFEKSDLGNQYKNNKPVTPIKEVNVTLGDFYKIGGKVVWI